VPPAARIPEPVQSWAHSTSIRSQRRSLNSSGGPRLQRQLPAQPCWRPSSAVLAPPTTPRFHPPVTLTRHNHCTKQKFMHLPPIRQGCAVPLASGQRCMTGISCLLRCSTCCACMLGSHTGGIRSQGCKATPGMRRRPQYDFGGHKQARSPGPHTLPKGARSCAYLRCSN